jgi:hypothetical protein
MRTRVISTTAAMMIAVAAMATSPGIRAQQRDPAAAEALFLEGKKAVQAGDLPTACTRYADSYRLDPTIGTLLNLADCQERIGNVATAWEKFKESLAKLDPDDKRRPIVEKKVPELEKRLPRLLLRAARSGPQQLTVVRDEVELGSSVLGVALPLNPGKHVVVVKAPKHEARRYEVVAEEGKTTELLVQPGPLVAEPEPAKSAPQGSSAAAPPAASASAAPPPSSGGSTLGWILVGVGGAGLVTGIASYAMMKKARSTVEEHCNTTTYACDSEGMDAARSGKTWTNVNTVSLIVGVLGVGVGAYFVLSGGSSSKPEPTTTAGFTAGPSGGGLWLRTRY